MIHMKDTGVGVGNGNAAVAFVERAEAMMAAAKDDKNYAHSPLKPFSEFLGVGTAVGVFPASRASEKAIVFNLTANRGKPW